AGEYAGAEKAYRAVIANGTRTQYYLNALYKLGWSIFKQERFFPAIDVFLVLYDELHMPDDPFVSKVQYDAGASEMRRDLINVITLSFAYSKGAEGLPEYFRARPARADQAVFYQYVVNNYLKQERYKEAAEVCQAYVQTFPVSAEAVRFQLRVIDIYEMSKQTTLLWVSRAQFAEKFNPTSNFWRLQDTATQSELSEKLGKVVTQLAAFHHAQAQATHRAEHAVEAIKWYKNYLAWFQSAADIGNVNFLLAELLFEQGQYAEAMKEYTRTAYEAGEHPKAVEAGYALTVTLEKLAQLAKDAQKPAWRRQSALGGLRFAKYFPHDTRVPMVLAHSAELFLELGDVAQAKAVAEGLLQKDSKNIQAQYRKSALLVSAQVATQENNLEGAEQYYRAALALSDGKNKLDADARERMATIAFKRAEQRLTAGDLTGAITGFTKVTLEGGGTSVAPVALFNAATVLLQQEKWAEAAALLEEFRGRFPRHELRSGVSEKLALAYIRLGQNAKAATEYDAVEQQSQDQETKRLAAWQAAELWAADKKLDKAIAAYERFRQRYVEPKDMHLHATIRLANLYNITRQNSFEETAKAAVALGLSQRSMLSAADLSELSKLALMLADKRFDTFNTIKLTLPLKKSLARKKQAMDVALAAYGRVGEFAVGEAITGSTHRVAELYQWFGREILSSERPKRLSKDEREQYDLQLEEEAVPFEEKAIALYEANVGRAKDGLYDVWVQRSFAALKQLKPARYSKAERSESVFATID
ncbi:MAG: tetratricopeptide repeat protein, partial [Gammaproteobacteria bacterium]|nr:tetratricopeptide repeat protein [Gammaproteobacteria bacterium]